MQRRPSLLLVVALALAAAATGAAAAYWLTRVQPAAPVSATVLDSPRPLPDFLLMDEHGRAVRAADLGGDWTLLFFGFTHCPDVCPLTLHVLERTLESMADLPPASRPVVRFVSVDPQRDTPERLASYLAFYRAELHGLTGEAAAVADFARALGVAYARVDGADGQDYTVDHTAALLLVDPRLQLVAVFTPPHDARALATDLRRIIRSGS